MARKHEKYERLLARAKSVPPVPTAVAHPCDESSLTGAVDASKIGLIVPILVGPAARIKAVFEGEEHGPHRDALVLGAALVLELTGRAAGPQGSTERVIATLDDGAAARLLSRLACAGREKG